MTTELGFADQAISWLSGVPFFRLKDDELEISQRDAEEMPTQTLCELGDLSG